MNIGRRYLCSRSSISRVGLAMPTQSTSDLKPGPYAGWTRERLIERLMQLESTPSEDETPSTGNATSSSKPTATTPNLNPIASTSTSSPALTPAPSSSKNFDFSKYPRRKIALKFCYSGWEYGGLAFQLGPTPLPTVENVLYDVLVKTRLVDPETGPEGCGWEKCGRTDRGVSSAGQVVSLWIRSALPAEELSQSPVKDEVKEEKVEELEGRKTEDEELPGGLEQDFEGLAFSIEPSTSNTSLQKTSSKKKVKEHDYLAMINRLLPDTIRVIAWSPVPTSFSARFSCKYRHYKYFFSSLGLDIPAMQAAAARFIGEHDFRNFCKLDAQKQITSFQRTILRATIEPLEGQQSQSQHGDMYVLDLVGTAFLYHQVRHIMAVLFLVGSGLEHPLIVTQLFNVREGAEPLRPEDEGLFEKYPVVDRKPEYMIADALPLMLWDCGYDESELDWRTSNIDTSSSSSNESPADTVRGGLYRQVQAIYNRSRVFSMLDSHFVDAVARYHPRPPQFFPLTNGLDDLEKLKDLPELERYMNIPLGGGTFKRSLKYTPLLKRKRLESVEATNERWRLAQLAKDASKAGGMTRVLEEDGNE